MRLHRFYIAERIEAKSEIVLRSRAIVDQLRKVFRAKAGDEIIVFDGSGSELTCAVRSFSGEDSAVLEVRSSAPARFMPSRKVWLFTAIIKKDLFETIVEKATELGATDIVPVLAERTEKKAVNEERLRKIAVEASEQSGRGDVPTIHGIEPLLASIERSQANGGTVVAFHTDGQQLVPAELSKGAALSVFIGPEGGWSPQELALFHDHGVPVRCLGPQVLRSETAVIAALSCAMFG